MSFGKTVLTKRALELNAAFLQADKGNEGIVITGVRGGQGDTSPDAAELVQESLDFSVIGDIAREGNRLTLQIFYENGELWDLVSLSEIGIYVQDGEGEVLYALAKAEPALPIAPITQGRIEVLCKLTIELSSNAQITLLVDSAIFMTRTEAINSFSPLGHEHAATEVNETVGKTTEEVQREQDYRLTLLERATGNMIVVRNLFNPQVWTITRGVLVNKTLISGGNVNGG